MQTSGFDDVVTSSSVDAADVPAEPAETVTRPRARAARRAVPDAACAAAVDLARAAALEVAEDDTVGEHLGVVAEEDRVVTHEFACLSRAYVGWRWTVVLARAPRSKLVTVDEVVLLPGPDSVLAPKWLPWSNRLRAGDLGPGDVLPTAPDDIRLAPGWGLGADPDQDEDVAQVWELGLGRPRVLSREGRDQAADRWYDGENGPLSPTALAAPARCATCGFLVPLGGSLRQAFGACTNEYSPSDGHVVSYDHGCGGHSEAVVVATPYDSALLPVLDDLELELVPVALAEDVPFEEELGHS